MEIAQNSGTPEPAVLPWVTVERIRKARGVSKKALAEHLQINYSYLVDLLNGRYPSKIDNEKIQILSRALDVPVNELLKFLSNPPPADQPIVIAETAANSRNFPKVATRLDKPGSLGPDTSVTPSTEFQIALVKHHSEEKVPDYVTTPPSAGSNLSPDTRAGKEYYKTRYWNNPNILAVKLEDDSMYPPFPVGTIFMVDTKRRARLNDIVFTILRDGRAWLREWSGQEGSEIILKSYNPKSDYLQMLWKDIMAMYPLAGLEIR